MECGRQKSSLKFFGRDLSAVLDIFTPDHINIGEKQFQIYYLRNALVIDFGVIVFRVRIEGEEPRFPIEIADFSLLLKGTNSSATPWYLHWSPYDWARDFHGAMKLYLNNEMTDFVDKILNEDPEILQVLMADVMGQVCERLVMDQEATELFHLSEAGTLGGQSISMA
jgi:hypothetical protein